MAKFLFVMTSSDQKFRIQQEEIDEYNAKKNGNFILGKYVANNKLPLTKLYNVVLSTIRKTEEKVDFILFMHADVKFDIDRVTARILECRDKYDIMGFAGCQKIDLREGHLSWFNGSRDFIEGRRGRIIHDNISEQVNEFSASAPDEADAQVAAVDGLCLVLGQNVVYSDMAFDEEFEFDFYDLDFCMEAVMKRNMKIGCIVEPIRHASVGFSITQPAYRAFEAKFREKWKVQEYQG